MSIIVGTCSCCGEKIKSQDEYKKCSECGDVFCGSCTKHNVSGNDVDQTGRCYGCIEIEHFGDLSIANSISRSKDSIDEDQRVGL